MSFICLFSGEVLLDLNLLPSNYFQEEEVYSMEISDSERDGNNFFHQYALMILNPELCGNSQLID